MSESGTSPKRQEVKDQRTHKIIGCAIAVHKAVGPGSRESVYEECMRRELRRQGIGFTQQTRVRLDYYGPVGKGFRPDFVVQKAVVLELKAVEVVNSLHVTQVLSYMRSSKVEIGLLINFNVELLIHGVRRLILTKSE